MKATGRQARGASSTPANRSSGRANALSFCSGRAPAGCFRARSQNSTRGTAAPAVGGNSRIHAQAKAGGANVP